MEPHRPGHRVAGGRGCLAAQPADGQAIRAINIRQANSNSTARARQGWAEEKLGHRFDSEALLERALTHRSASKDNNERLEYLGDALLSFVVAARLFDQYRTAPEGDLSRLRSALVKGETLTEIARELGVEDHLIVGAAELRSGGTGRSSVLANALEAVLGAIFLDAGLDQAQRCVHRLLDERLEALPDAASLKDPKSRLQEWLQSRGFDLPRYVVESDSGPPHARRFVVACRVDERGLEVSGQGSNRRGAEQEAADRMLASLTSE